MIKGYMTKELARMYQVTQGFSGTGSNNIISNRWTTRLVL